MIAQIASEELFVRETSPNHGPDIEKFWADTTDKDGYALRYPYCAAFVSFCVNEAKRRGLTFTINEMPRFEAVAQWRDWAITHDLQFYPHDEHLNPEPGDLVHYLPQLSHIGIVTSFDGVFVETIEANTDADGTREGDGVYRKSRQISFCGAFIRIPIA